MTALGPRSAVVFDLDGVLVDSHEAMGTATTWATGDEGDLLGAGPDLVVRTPSDLLELCPSLPVGGRG